MRSCESAPIQVPVGTFSCRIDKLGGMDFVHTSQTFLGILEAESENMSALSRLFPSAVHPDDSETFSDFRRKAADRLQPLTWEGRLVVAREVKSVRLDLSPPPNGDLKRIWTGALQDLTAVKELQDRFESVLDAAQAFTWRRDMRSGQLQFGSRWAQFAKHDDGETSVPSDDWLAKVHPDDASEVLAQVQAMERGEVDHRTLLYRRQLEDGRWVWLRVHAGISERDEAGVPRALSGVSFDVTAEIEERGRSATENRALRHELYDAQLALERTAYEITEHIPVGTYTMVLKPGEDLAHFGFMSRRFLEITGLEEEDARADPLRAFACVHPDDYYDWVQKNTHAFVHKQRFREEARLLVKGQLRWIVAESIPRQNEDGTWIWEGVIQDITSQKVSEQARTRANRELLDIGSRKARLEERELLLKDIHDGFGNQLAIGKLRLRRGAVPVEKAVEIIDDSLADLRLLIDSLDAEGESLRSVLSALLERLDARTRSLPITLEWDIDAAGDIHLPPRDHLQAARIVQEAVSNALRHAGASVISTAVRVENGRPIIEVRDDGKGFDLAQASTGRGLNNMRARAEQQGWQLQITSDGCGTHCQVVLDS